MELRIADRISRYTIWIVILLLSLGCLPGTLQAEEVMTEQRAIAMVEAFFDTINIETYDSGRFAAGLAPGFSIFEMGEEFDAASFDAFISEAAKTIVETRWILSDFDVSIGDDLTHLSYTNVGRFVNMQGGVIHSEWMESVLLELVDAAWKIKFLQSDLVERWVVSPDGTRTELYPVEDEESDEGMSQSSIPH
jgi:hypothetical protein